MSEKLKTEGEPSVRLMIDTWFNGSFVGRVGIEEFGSVHAGVRQYRGFTKRGTDSPEGRFVESTTMGITGSQGGKDVHWGKKPATRLKAGDEIIFKIIESDTMDKPEIE